MHSRAPNQANQELNWTKGPFISKVGVLDLFRYNNRHTLSVAGLTCGRSNCPNKNRGYSHDEAPKSSQEGEDLSVGSRGGR